MAELKPLDREALLAFYIQGESLIEIAERLAVPIGTVKRRLHTARKRLRAELVAQVNDAGEWSETATSVELEDENSCSADLVGIRFEATNAW